MFYSHPVISESMTSVLNPAEDTGLILVKVQDELRHLRDQIANGDNIDLTFITAAINRTEKAVQGRAEQLLTIKQNEVLTLPALTIQQPQQITKFKPQPQAPTQQRSRVTTFNPHKTPGQMVKEDWLARMVTAPMGQPNNPDARDIIEQQYGVQKPKEKYQLPPIIPQKPIHGTTVKGSPPLPKANRINPRLTPPAITEKDAKKGILSLCERGLIPPAAELTLEPSPIKHTRAMFHQAVHVSNMEKIADAHELEHTMAGVHLDNCVHDMPIVPYTKSRTSHPSRQSSLPPRGKSRASAKTLPRGSPFSALAFHPPGPPQTPTPQHHKSFKFTIQNGRTIHDHTDFEEFRKDNTEMWSDIVPCIQELEMIMSQFAVPVAIVDGDALSSLSERFKMDVRPPLEQLIQCCSNHESILSLMETPGQIYKGPQGYDLAAAKIQATWRMYAERVRYFEYRDTKKAVAIIAMNWIMVMKMTTIRSRLKTTRGYNLTKFRERLKDLKTSWPRMQTEKRVIIHLPSRGYTQTIRDSLVDYHVLQNSQMGRICDINDPNVEVIYISPVDLDNDMHQYYQKLMSMGVSKDGTNITDSESKFKCIVPDHLDAFPGLNFCLSSLLLYSAKTMKRLKSLIAGKTAYIVPGLMHRDDMELAEALNIPVIGAEPDIVHLYSTKSGAKRIFASAGVQMPPSEFDIYTEDQLFELISTLIASNLNVKKWVFKIDGEFDGRGTACCDITTFLKCHKWAAKQAERYGSKWGKRWAQEPAITKIYTELPSIIYQNLKIVNKTLFSTPEKFLLAFTKSGGVVEACPPSDDVTCVTVDMFISPTGDIEIKNTGDQIRATEFQTWGISTPQTSVDPTWLHHDCTAVAKACYERGIIGYISTGWATFIDPTTLKQCLWAIDLKIQYTDTLCMANVLQYVTGGFFDSDVGMFRIPEYKVMPELSSRFKSPKARQPPNHRFAVISPRLFHTNLSLVHYSVFFQMCRAHHIGYDIREREGSIFTLIDSFKREMLGMLVIEPDLVSALKAFTRNLSTVHQEISSPNMPGENNFNSLIEEVEKILRSVMPQIEEGTEEGPTIEEVIAEA